MNQNLIRQRRRLPLMLPVLNHPLFILRLRDSLALALLALTLATPVLRAQDGKAIVAALVRKGILTVAEAEQLVAETANFPLPATVVPNAKATTRLALGGRVQLQYDGLSTAIANAPAPAATSHFFVRRAYLVLKAAVGRGQQVDVVYDLAANSFEDAILNWRPDESLSFDFGLRKVSFAAEERSSSGSLKAIERSAATRYFVEANNGRRLGAGSNRVGIFAEGTRGIFFWNAALTNPELATTAGSIGTAASNTPAVWGGAGVKGKFPDGAYLVGASFGFLPDQGGRTPGTGRDLRVGSINTEVSAGNFNLIAEYLASRNELGSAAGRDAASWGFYVQPSFKFDQHWEGVARYSYVNSDGRGITLSDSLRSAPSGGMMDKLTEYYLGFTYYIAGNDLKLQAGYVHGESKDTVTGTAAKATASGVRSQLQVQF